MAAGREQKLQGGRTGFILWAWECGPNGKPKYQSEQSF